MALEAQQSRAACEVSRYSQRHFKGMPQNLVACSRAMTRRSRAVTPSALNELSRTAMRTRVQYCIPIGAALRPGSLLGLRSVQGGAPDMC